MTAVVVERVESVDSVQQNEPSVVEKFEQLQQTAVDFITSNSIFTNDIASCLVEFMPFEPDNCIQVLDNTSITGYAEIIESCINAASGKWIIAEKTQFSLQGQKEIIAVYYCNPTVFVKGTRQSFILIGKCKFHVQDVDTQNDVDADDRIAYFAMTGGQDSVLTNTSKQDSGAKVDFCTVWHSLYWFGLPNDEMREECLPKRWFVVDQNTQLK